MKYKKISAVMTAIVLVFTATLGICVPKEQAMAAVNSSLPKVSGLYIADYYSWDEGNKVKTDKDGKGNIVPVDEDGTMISYWQQDNPQYLTDGIQNEYGMNLKDNDCKWLDYIDAAKGTVTHVNPSDLTVTYVDGTPCKDVVITPDPSDSRLSVFSFSTMEKVKIAYRGASQNNSMIIQCSLRSGFYASEELSLASQITNDYSNEVNIVRGRSKELYLHLADTAWEEAGFRLDSENPLTVIYWDNEKEQDVELTGEDADEFVTFTPVNVDDPHHQIYKLIVQGKETGDNGDGYSIRVNFTEYDQNNPSGNSWDEEQFLWVRPIDANTLYTANTYDLDVKGDRYIYPSHTYFGSNNYFGAGSTTNAIYMQFKYADADGNMKDVTDPGKICAYSSQYDGEQEKEIFTKVDSTVIKVEKAYSDNSSIMKVSYVGKKADFGNEYVLTYNGAEPSEYYDKNIKIAFSPAVYNEIGTYRLPFVNDANYSKEFRTDGTKDLDIYVASMDVSSELFWNQIQSITLESLSLTDENYRDLSEKIKSDRTVTITGEKNYKAIYGEKITIPKGTLTSSAKLYLVYEIQSKANEEQEQNPAPYRYEIPVYIFYSAPAVSPTPTGTASIAGAAVSGIQAGYSYTGKEQKPVPTVKISGKTLSAGKDYTVSYSNNINAGTAAMVIKGIGAYTGQKTISFTITKAKNPLTLKVSKKTYSRKKNLKKKKKSFSIGAKNAQGAVTYTLSKKAKKAKISVSKKGKVIVPKKCKKGRYTITVKAKGNANYESAKKTVTIVVKA